MKLNVAKLWVVVVVVVVAIVDTAWKRKRELHGEIMVEKYLQ